MHTLITIVHVIACIFMILVVLLQSGRGGGMGAAFAGASGQIFGGRGASSFLSRATTVAACVFFVTSLTLSMLDSRQSSVVRGMTAKPAKKEGEAGDAAGKGADGEQAKDSAAGKDAGDKDAGTKADGDKADGDGADKADAAGKDDKTPEGANIAPEPRDDVAPGDAQKPGKPEAVPPGAPEK